MELTFIFTKMPLDDPDVLKGGYRKSLELPDSAVHDPSCQERVMKVAESIDQLSDCFVFVTCLPLGLKEHLISQKTVLQSYGYSFLALVQRFKRVKHPRKRMNKLLRFVILEPNHFPFGKYSKPYFSLSKDLTKISERDEHSNYFFHLNQVVDNLLFLLNIEPDIQWADGEFMPNWFDEQAKKTQSKRIGRYVAQQNKQNRLKQKLDARKQEQIEKGDIPLTEPQHGAGRRPGARPGIYKGISMRSQLEIRFAAELDERNIRWFYESESVGDAGYLIDFYLPDLGVWVEVKGTMIAKDRQVLPDVAKHLKQTRQHRLMMYMQSKAYVINPSGFREIEAKRFWDELVK